MGAGSGSLLQAHGHLGEVDRAAWGTVTRADAGTVARTVVAREVGVAQAAPLRTGARVGAAAWAA